MTTNLTTTKKPYLLSDIININDLNYSTSILYELIHPYKKALYTYYKNYFNCEPVLMVVSVSNTAQYIKIVPANEFLDAIEIYLSDSELTEEEREHETETINFYSKLLKEFIN
jgi:hypothetical protein